MALCFLLPSGRHRRADGGDGHIPDHAACGPVFRVSIPVVSGTESGSSPLHREDGMWWYCAGTSHGSLVDILRTWKAPARAEHCDPSSRLGGLLKPLWSRVVRVGLCVFAFLRKGDREHAGCWCPGRVVENRGATGLQILLGGPVGQVVTQAAKD